MTGKSNGYLRHFSINFVTVIYLRWMIPPMVVHPEKTDFHHFV